MIITEEINFKGHDLKVKGYYQKEEERVDRYSDGSGYPGRNSEFEAEEIYLGKEEILEFLSDISEGKVIWEIEQQVLEEYERGRE